MITLPAVVAANAALFLVVFAISFFLGKRAGRRQAITNWSGAMNKLAARIDLAERKVADSAFPKTETATAQTAISQCRDQLSQLTRFGCVPNWGLFMLNIHGLPDYIDTLAQKSSAGS